MTNTRAPYPGEKVFGGGAGAVVFRWREGFKPNFAKGSTKSPAEPSPSETPEVKDSAEKPEKPEKPEK
jgi:hypothetical protein